MRQLICFGIEEVAIFSNRQLAETEEIWHKRLGHCSMKILQKL